MIATLTTLKDSLIDGICPVVADSHDRYRIDRIKPDMVLAYSLRHGIQIDYPTRQIVERLADGRLVLER